MGDLDIFVTLLMTFLASVMSTFVGFFAQIILLTLAGIIGMVVVNFVVYWRLRK